MEARDSVILTIRQPFWCSTMGIHGLGVQVCIAYMCNTASSKCFFPVYNATLTCVNFSLLVTGHANFQMDGTALSIGWFTQPGAECGFSQQILWIYPKPTFAKFDSLKPVPEEISQSIGKKCCLKLMFLLYMFVRCWPSLVTIIDVSSQHNLLGLRNFMHGWLLHGLRK